MDTRFEHLGYHLDLYCPRTKKYEGSITLSDEVVKTYGDREKGYVGRREESIVAVGRKGMKEKNFSGEYITELVPLCGRLVGDRFNTLRDVHQKTIAMRRH